MPQTTIAYPNTMANIAGGALDPDWQGPDGAKRDDGLFAQVQVGGGLTSDTLRATEWNLLAEDSGSVAGGIVGSKIPAGASIVGIRFIVEYDLTSGNTPTVALTGSHFGNTVFPAQAMGVRSRGYGTLSAGSSSAAGNLWGPHDLSTAAGQVAARAGLGDGAGGLSVGLTVTNPLGVNQATGRVDHFRVQVEWVLRADVAGGAAASGEGGGSVVQQTTATGGAAAPASGGATPKMQASQSGAGAAAPGSAGAAQQSIVHTQPHVGVAVAAGGGQLPHVIVVTLPDDGATTEGEGGGVARVFSYSLTGVARDATGVPLAGARVDLHRADSGARIASTVSAADGTFGLPVTSEPIDYFLRSFKAGPPNRFATTDEDLRAAEEQVQGPPL